MRRASVQPRTTAASTIPSCSRKRPLPRSALKPSIRSLSGEKSRPMSVLLALDDRGEETVGVVDVGIEPQVVAGALQIDALALQHLRRGHEREIRMRAEEA